MGLVRVFALLPALLLSACGGEPVSQAEHETSAPTAHDVVSLGVTARDDVVHAVWVEQRSDDRVRAMHSQSSDGGRSWRGPVAIDTGQAPPDRVHRSNDIRIAVHDDRIRVIWQTRGDGFADSGPMVLAASDDGGRSWAAAPAPATIEDSPAHGFFALHADSEGSFHLAWLDMRDGRQGLRYARQDGSDNWGPTHTLDAATCECCWNTLITAGDEVRLLYRALDPRDMAMSASSDGGRSWQKRGAVGGFDWRVDACPHVGGDLAVRSVGMPQLHAVVWTGHEDHEGIYALHTPLEDGAAWSGPRRLGDRGAGNPALTGTHDNKLLAAWDDGGEIHLARHVDDQWRESVLAGSGAAASHPLLTATSHGQQVFWTERGEDGQRLWRMALLND